MLGRLRPEAFLGGEMPLNALAARGVMQSIAKRLGMWPEQAAEGVIRIANEHMAHALRVMSVQRGIDPRGLTLVSFGGAGGLHVCALAESLGMQQAMVPIHAGVLSALGMFVAPRSRQLSRPRIARLVIMPHDQIDTVYAGLEAQGRQELIAEGVASAEIEVRRSLDLRYEGQSYYLNLPWDDIRSCEAAFHRLHAERYGHELDLPVELVNLRVGLTSRPTPLVLASPSAGVSSPPYDQVSLYGVEQPAAVYARDGLVAGQQLTGPALVTETISTTYLAPDWRCDVDTAGNLLLRYQAE